MFSRFLEEQKRKKKEEEEKAVFDFNKISDSLRTGTYFPGLTDNIFG